MDGHIIDPKNSDPEAPCQASGVNLSNLGRSDEKSVPSRGAQDKPMRYRHNEDVDNVRLSIKDAYANLAEVAVEFDFLEVPRSENDAFNEAVVRALRALRHIDHGFGLIVDREGLEREVVS